MSDGVLIERDGRLEFYPRLPKCGYVIPSHMPVRVFRTGRLLIFPVGFLALMVVRPQGPWTAALVMGTASLCVDLLRQLPLRGLPRTPEPLPLDVWRRESTIQQSPVYLGVMFFGIVLSVAAAVAVMMIRRRAPFGFVVICIAFSLGAAFIARQWRHQRRAVRNCRDSPGSC